MEGYKELNKKRAIGIRKLRKETAYDFPIFNDDFGDFIAILDYKGWGNNNCVCFFTLESGRKLKITAYKNKSGYYSAQKSDYDFSQNDNLGRIFKINISKTKTENTKFVSGELLYLNETEEMTLVNKIIENEENYKKPFLKDYWNEINNMKKLELEFFESCKNGNIEMVKYFLNDRGVNINANDFNGGSSGLRLASSNNHIEVVKYLLESEELKKHADFKLKDKFGLYPAFRVACSNNHKEVVQYFIDNYTINEENIKKAVRKAFLYYNRELLFLIINGFKLDVVTEINECLEKYSNELYEIDEIFMKEMRELVKT